MCAVCRALLEYVALLAGEHEEDGFMIIHNFKRALHL